jgi:hypoxanthine phosphoribosyltransferase
MDKTYLDAQELLEDAFQLGADVINSGFEPSVIIAIWRGGAPIGIAVQEMLAYSGIETDHIAIRTSSYANAIDDRSSSIRIHGMNYLVKNFNRDDRLLIVDDVFDTGHTINAVINHLHEIAKRNTPADIRVAVPYYKPTKNETDRVPDYYVHETQAWLKFPHSLEGLTEEEIAEHRPEIFNIVRSKTGCSETGVT